MDNAPPPPPPPFHRFGPAVPLSPVVISVPHAGRHYPAAMLPLLGVPVARLTALEDRHVDAVAHAAHRGETMLVATHARAWIDLNRSPLTDRDPWIDADAARLPGTGSDKVRSGIGLIPRRGAGADNMWRRKLSGVEVAARIAGVHAPYHAALAAALAAARARFGTAMLLDLHSMPPLTGPNPAQIVLGDRFGRSCPGHVTAQVADVVRDHGLSLAIDRPYAGGHILDTHARPRSGIHALQLEIDRSLYLDAAQDGPGPGVARMAMLVRAIIDVLAAIAQDFAHPAAAE